MLAGQYDITVEQGSTFSLTLVYQDQRGYVVPLTGYTARMQLRHSAAAATSQLELTTENGRIAITPEEGRISLSIPASVTAALSALPGVYDLEIVNGTFVQRILEGAYTVSPEVTR